MYVLYVTMVASFQDRAADLVLRVLQSFKTSDIEKAVKSLDEPMVDVLMKYIYRGFESPVEGANANLLTWHEKVSLNWLGLVYGRVYTHTGVHTCVHV